MRVRVAFTSGAVLGSRPRTMVDATESDQPSPMNFHESC